MATNVTKQDSLAVPCLKKDIPLFTPAFVKDSPFREPACIPPHIEERLSDTLSAIRKTTQTPEHTESHSPHPYEHLSPEVQSDIQILLESFYARNTAFTITHALDSAIKSSTDEETLYKSIDRVLLSFSPVDHISKTCQIVGLVTARRNNISHSTAPKALDTVLRYVHVCNYNTKASAYSNCRVSPISPEAPRPSSIPPEAPRLSSIPPEAPRSSSIPLEAPGSLHISTAPKFLSSPPNAQGCSEISSSHNAV